MKFLCVTVCCLVNAIIVESYFSPCITPNGENAYCIPLRYCAVLKTALFCLDESVQDFVEESFCEKAKVCCGTIAHYVKFPAPPAIKSIAAHPIRENPVLVKPVTEKLVIKQQIVENVKGNEQEMKKLMKRKYALQHLIPSKTYCGLQHFDDYYHLEKENNDFIATVDEFPWLVALDKEGICNGVLISNRYLLTLPYCAKPPHKTAIIGQHSSIANVSCTKTSFGDDCTDPKQEIEIEEYTESPNNTFSLVRLAEKIFYSDYVRPICLPMEGREQPKVNETVVVTSWDDCFFANTSICENKSKRRRYDLTLISVKDCEKEIDFEFPIATVCGVPQQNSSLTVDILFPVGSGKPLMYNYKDNWFLSGIHVEQINRNPRFLYAAQGITQEDVNWILEIIRD